MNCTNTANKAASKETLSDNTVCTSTTNGNQLSSKTSNEGETIHVDSPIKKETPIQRLYRQHYLSASSLGFSTRNILKSSRGGKKDEAPKLPERKEELATSTGEENQAPHDLEVLNRTLPPKKKERTLEEVFSEYDRIVNLQASHSSLRAVIGAKESETEEPKEDKTVEEADDVSSEESETKEPKVDKTVEKADDVSSVPPTQAFETVPASTDILAPLVELSRRGTDRVPPLRGSNLRDVNTSRGRVPVRAGLEKQATFKGMQHFSAPTTKSCHLSFARGTTESL
jgi:hypothetical protein